MKESFLSINALLMGTSRFIINLFLMALVCGVGFTLFVMGAMIFAPLFIVSYGGSFADCWYWFPIGVISPYLFYNWIRISPSILDIAKQEKTRMNQK